MYYCKIYIDIFLLSSFFGSPFSDNLFNIETKRLLLSLKVGLIDTDILLFLSGTYVNKRLMVLVSWQYGQKKEEVFYV
jgi:hypothetical protein